MMFNGNEKSYIKQENINDISPINKEQTKIILTQLENTVCKIYENNKEKGTGFLCKIPYLNQFKLLPVLITSVNVLNEEYLKMNKYIEITFDDNKQNRKLNINNSRYIFLSKLLNVTIVEIIPDDKLNNLLDIDLETMGDNYGNIFTEKTQIYILQYPLGEKLSFSVGRIKRIWGKNIDHLCNVKDSSSGSPILCLSNYKVIGVHIKNINYGNMNDNNFQGTFIKFVIEEFIKDYLNNSKNINFK